MLPAFFKKIQVPLKTRKCFPVYGNGIEHYLIKVKVCRTGIPPLVVTSFHQKRGYKGRFSEADNPPAKRVMVCLPEPFLDALDAYGKENKIGRGKSIQKLLEGVLAVDTPPDAGISPSALPPAQKSLVKLELVQRNDPLYMEWRKNHYIPHRGVVGQQLQYLVFYGDEIAGVIGGASAVFSNQARNDFFGLSNEKDLKAKQLTSIVNNNIFRLTNPAPNLASIVLGMWRKRICKDWKTLYGVEVAGFETFVVEERLWGGRKRDGVCYRADNWELVGLSKGYKNTNVRGRETNNKSLKSKKLVYCKKIKGKELNTKDYQTAWFDKELQAQLKKKRQAISADPLDLLIKSVRAA